MRDYLRLEDVILIGRTFDEYRRIFALDQHTLETATILDAASGVSSFCAEANAAGYNVTASDRAYQFSPDELERKCKADLEEMLPRLVPVKQNYVWNIFPDIAVLGAQRELAYTRFIADFRQHGHSRYIPVTYPQSPFKEDQFTLSLVSHLLFLYDEQLDYAFHTAMLLELLRVTSGEVRIFPLQNLKAERSPFVGRLQSDRTFAPYTLNTVTVDYEFIQGGNQMLVINRP